MKIKEQEISQEIEGKINQIVNEFENSQHVVTECTVPKYGRSSGTGTHYCLNVDNQKIISVKLAFNLTAEIIQWELLMSTIRQMLSVPHYKIERKRGFPISGWEDQDYMMIEKGPIGHRKNLGELDAQESIRNNRKDFLKYLGKTTAMNFLFGISDRSVHNHVWDMNEKVLYSIDHEILSNNDEEIPSTIKNNILDFLVGKNWYDCQELRDAFTESFNETWQFADCSQAAIISNFTDFSLQQYSASFLERLRKGPQWVLQRIMSQNLFYMSWFLSSHLFLKMLHR